MTVKAKSVHETLAEIQTSLKAPKGQTNKFGGYRYRSCEDIVEAVKPLLNGATLTLSDDIILVADRVYVKATASLQIGGDAIHVSACAREAAVKKGMDEAQITGAASSYARKYALNGLLAIDDTKDADATNEHGKKAANSHVKNDDPVSCKQLVNESVDSEMVANSVINYFGGDKASARDFIESAGFPIPSQCNQEELEGILAALAALEKKERK